MFVIERGIDKNDKESVKDIKIPSNDGMSVRKGIKFSIIFNNNHFLLSLFRSQIWSKDHPIMPSYGNEIILL